MAEWPQTVDQHGDGGRFRPGGVWMHVAGPLWLLADVPVTRLRPGSWMRSAKNEQANTLRLAPSTPKHKREGRANRAGRAPVRAHGARSAPRTIIASIGRKLATPGGDDRFRRGGGNCPPVPGTSSAGTPRKAVCLQGR